MLSKKITFDLHPQIWRLLERRVYGRGMMRAIIGAALLAWEDLSADDKDRYMRAHSDLTRQNGGPAVGGEAA